MKAILIKGMELPTGENNFADVRIQSNGKALLYCGMGECDVYPAEEIEIEDEK